MEWEYKGVKQESSEIGELQLLRTIKNAMTSQKIRHTYKIYEQQKNTFQEYIYF